MTEPHRLLNALALNVSACREGFRQARHEYDHEPVFGPIWWAWCVFLTPLLLLVVGFPAVVWFTAKDFADPDF